MRGEPGREEGGDGEEPPAAADGVDGPRRERDRAEQQELGQSRAFRSTASMSSPSPMGL